MQSVATTGPTSAADHAQRVGSRCATSVTRLPTPSARVPTTGIPVRSLMPSALRPSMWSSLHEHLVMDGTPGAARNRGLPLRRLGPEAAWSNREDPWPGHLPASTAAAASRRRTGDLVALGLGGASPRPTGSASCSTTPGPPSVGNAPLPLAASGKSTSARKAPAGSMWTLPGYGDHLEEGRQDLRQQMTQMGAPEGFMDVVASLSPIADDDSETPAHWSVTFGVDDADDTAAKASELGGEVVAGPVDAPVDQDGDQGPAGGDLRRQPVRPREPGPRGVDGSTARCPVFGERRPSG